MCFYPFGPFSKKKAKPFPHLLLARMNVVIRKKVNLIISFNNTLAMLLRTAECAVYSTVELLR